MHRPEVVNIAKGQLGHHKTSCPQTPDHQLLATRIFRGYRTAANQVAGQKNSGGIITHGKLRFGDCRQTSNIWHPGTTQLCACKAAFNSIADWLVRHSTAPLMELRRNSRSDLPASSRALISPTG